MWLHSSLEGCSHMAFFMPSIRPFSMLFRMEQSVSSAILAGSKAVIMISIY
jgi:hypothetical protein